MFVVMDNCGTVHGVGDTAIAAVEEVITCAQLRGGAAETLQALAEYPPCWHRNSQELQLVAATRRLINAVQLHGGAAEDVGAVIRGNGFAAIADLPTVKVGGRDILAPRVAHRRLELAWQLADEAKLLSQEDAAQVFGPSHVEWHEQQTLDAAISRLGGYIVFCTT